MSTVLGLYRLQRVDSQIDHIQSRLTVIRQALEQDEELRVTIEKAALAENKHREVERALKISEVDVERQRIKIEQAEATMYGGHIHNPKELQELQHEVASLKRYLTTLEERELEAMLAVEEAEIALNSAKNDLQGVQARLNVHHRELANERDSLDKDLERLDAERQAAVSALESQLLSLYEQLRQQRRGIAVTTVSDSSCEACGTTLTPAQQQNARHGLFQCPSCGRILFAN